MDNIKTYSNCVHYCAVLADPNSAFHIHDYCKVWRAAIPSSYLADIEEKELEEKYTDLNGDYHGPVIYNDIETNRAVCWCWKEKNNNDTSSN